MILSIIIPVFNEEKTIIQILKKITKNSTDKVKYEIIVVDDGSTDDNSPRSSRLKPGEFRVLCSQGSGYWCERLNDLDGKRDIQSFQKKYVKRLISK